MKVALDKAGDAEQTVKVMAALNSPVMRASAKDRRGRSIGMSYEDLAMQKVSSTYFRESYPIMYRLFGRSWGMPDWQSIIDWIVENLPKLLQLLATVLPFLI